MACRYFIYQFICLTIAGVLMTSCRNAPDIKGFNQKQWKKDRNACNKQRQGEVEALLDGRKKLIGLDQGTVRSLLGKPEKVGLYRRGRRYYYYFLEPGPLCKDNPKEQYYKVLSLQLNAMDMVKEITIKRKSF